MQTHQLDTVRLALVSLFVVLCASTATAAASAANLLAHAARAGKPDPSPKPIPWDQIRAKVRADYQGDARAVSATGEGARLKCGSQKLERSATPRGVVAGRGEPGTAAEIQSRLKQRTHRGFRSKIQHQKERD